MADRRLAWALVAVIVRYLTTIQPHARRELARWRQRAHAIPNPQLRRGVLRPFETDRSAEGAAIFAVLEPRRRHDLVPLLIAYVLLWSCVDVMSERDPGSDGRVLDALIDALSPEVPVVVRFEDEDDHGYLAELVRVCRQGCARLPSWDVAGQSARRLAGYGAAVQAINHGPPERAEARLRCWAQPHAVTSSARWQELCAGASSPLAIHALIALGASREATLPEAVATATTYYPAFSALSVLADHLLDQGDDAELSDHSYLRYYDGTDDVADRMAGLAAAVVRDAATLRHGERHTIILAAMIAMFFSETDPTTKNVARPVVDAIGPAATILLAVAKARKLGCVKSKA